jgi:phage-related protein
MHAVIFFRTAGGNEPVREWLRGLGREEKAVIGDDLRTIQFGFPIGMPLCRSLAHGLYEARSSLPTKREARLIFFESKRRLVVVNGFIKKSRKTPDHEIALASARKREFERNEPQNA